MPAATLNASGEALEPIKINLGKSVPVTAAGTVQGNAAAISARVSQATGDDTAGVVLPATARPGDIYAIYNLAATAGLKVYPPVTGATSDINDGSSNAAVVQEGKTLGLYMNLDGVTWGAIFTTNT